MYAVIKTGGKQYRVSPGETLRVEKLDRTAGESVVFDQVLMVSDDAAKVSVGKPFLSNATVTAEVVKQGRADKIIIIKMKRRKHYMRRQGHRQDFTEIKITDIKVAA